MSNHSGSYMLNAVLTMLDEEYTFFEGKSQEEVVQIFQKFTEIGAECDCNDGEILEEIGEKYGVCYCCMKHSTGLEDGVCYFCGERYIDDIIIDQDMLKVEYVEPKSSRYGKDTKAVVLTYTCDELDEVITVKKDDSSKTETNYEYAIYQLQEEIAKKKM